jgi:tRNA threonylcarbamoyladenosine biosynthesis protein TsaE
MSGSVIYESGDLAGTEALGRLLASLLRPGDVVSLIGPLGAGKTQLVRAIAEGLGVPDGRVVSSPTFVLIQEYEGRMPVYHFDTYRLRNPEEFAELGVHEYFAGSGVSLVEWGDRVENILPADHLRITISVIGETSRRFIMEGTGARSREIMVYVARSLSALDTQASSHHRA